MGIGGDHLRKSDTYCTFTVKMLMVSLGDRGMLSVFGIYSWGVYK